MDHHYVPQFLLQPWSDPNADRKLVSFRLDLAGLPSKRLKPRATGFETNLYALTKPMVAGMEQQAIEKTLLRIVDNAGAKARRKLDLQGLAQLTPQERIDWVQFLMSLRARRPHVISKLRTYGAEVLREHLAKDASDYEGMRNKDTDPPTLEGWAEKHFPGLVENAGLSMFSRLVLNPTIGNKILRMRWWIWDFAQAQRELLLADDPLIYLGDIDHPNLVIALPISPTKAFFTTQSKFMADGMKVAEARLLAENLNAQSVLNARVRLYARNENSRRFIENKMRFRK